MATLREFQAPPGYTVQTPIREQLGLKPIECLFYWEAKGHAAYLSHVEDSAVIGRDPWDSPIVSRGEASVARFVNGQQVFPPIL